MKENKGYKTVERSGAGLFASPYSEPMGKSLGVRFPLSLDNWLVKEAERKGCTKTDLVREAVRLMSETTQEEEKD